MLESVSLCLIALDWPPRESIRGRHARDVSVALRRGARSFEVREILAFRASSAAARLDMNRDLLKSRLGKLPQLPPLTCEDDEEAEELLDSFPTEASAVASSSTRPR